MGNIYLGEIRKVLRKHTVCGFILILFAGYIIYLVSGVYGKAGGEQYSYQAYQKLAATVDSENLPKEIERLEGESEDFSDKELYTDSFQAEYALYDEVLRQMRHAAGYAEYADGMVENAQKGEISLFQENNYTRREQEKTVRDFGRLRTYPVTFAPYRGVYLLAGFDFGDIVILVILVLLVASLVTMEKENRTLPLLHSTFHGRKRVGAAKFLGGLSLLLSGMVFLFACKSLIILATYGTGDWNGAVQSVYPYGSCRYGICVWEFLVLSAIGRIMGYFALYAVLFFLAAFIKRGAVFYCSCGIFLGLEGIFSVVVEEFSWVGFLRSFNVIPFLNSDIVIGKYQNVNVFQRPVDYAFVASVIEVCFFVVFSALGIYSFERCIELKEISFLKKKKDRIRHFAACLVCRRESRLRYCPDSVFLFVKELKKVWIGEKGLLLFLIGLLFLFFLYSPLKEGLSDKDEIYYSHYMLKLQGKYSEEKMAYLYQEREELEQIQEALDSGKHYTAAQIEILAQKTERLAGLEMAIQNAEYVQENGFSHLVYEKGYLTLFGEYEGGWELLKLRVISLLVMAGLAASVWGIEAWSGMDQVLRISEKGERFLKRLKRHHIALLSLVVFVVTYAPWVWNVAQAYDCSQWLAPIGSIMQFRGDWFGGMPIVAAAGLFGAMHLLYLYFSGILIRIVRKRMGNYIFTVLVSFVIFAIPVFAVSGSVAGWFFA
jgi:hypothetical protein